MQSEYPDKRNCVTEERGEGKESYGFEVWNKWVQRGPIYTKTENLPSKQIQRQYLASHRLPCGESKFESRSHYLLSNPNSNLELIPSVHSIKRNLANLQLSN